MGSEAGATRSVLALDSVAPALSLVGASRRYGASLALDSFNLELVPGSIHALLGQNGAGKSTAVKIMTGVEQPDSGEVRLGGQVVRLTSPGVAQQHGIITVYQELQGFADLSVAENLFIGRMGEGGRWGGIDWPGRLSAARKILADFNLNIDVAAPLRQFGVGVQQLVEIARAMIGAPRVLVLDEPTVRLSRAEADLLFAVMRDLRRRGVAILLIAHDLAQVFDIADTVTVLRDGRKVASVATEATNRDEVIGWMVGRVPTMVTEAKPGLPRQPLLEAKGMAIEQGGVSFDVNVATGEIVGIAGLVGSGADEIGRQIAGVSRLRSGQVRFAGKLLNFSSPAAAIESGIVYMPGDRKRLGLFLPLTVSDNVIASVLREVSARLVISERSVRARAKAAIASLGVRPADPNRKIVELSGGNQQKVLFSRVLQANPRLVVLENPTVGVDVAAQAEIHGAIRQVAQTGVGVLVVSTDFAELAALCERVLVVRGGKVAAELTQNISPDTILSQVTGDSQP